MLSKIWLTIQLLIIAALIIAIHRRQSHKAPNQATEGLDDEPERNTKLSYVR